MIEHLSLEQLKEIATIYDTPVYVYQAEKIKEQYQKLQNAFSAMPTVFFYACKALTNINILQYIRSIGCNIDCSSLNEVHMALAAGFTPNQILYTSNGVAFQEIIAVQEIGAHINIDSISNLEKFGKRYGHSYPVGVRLRPNILAGGNLNISTGHDTSKFGIPINQVNKVLAVVKEYNIHVQGLHIHTGSDIKDVNVFVQGMEVLFEIIPHFPELRFLDLGSGFKVAYKQGDPTTDIDLLAKKLQESLEAHANVIGRTFEIWFEPGKYLVSECGYFITQVNVLKETDNVHFVGINTGFNHLIRPMFYDAYHEIKNISNPDAPQKEYAIVGNLCETDTFAWERALNEVREGDYLLFYNTGAYGFEMSSNYNSRYKPAEVLVKDGKTMLIRKRDTWEHLISNQILLSEQ